MAGFVAVVEINADGAARRGISAVEGLAVRGLLAAGGKTNLIVIMGVPRRASAAADLADENMNAKCHHQKK